MESELRNLPKDIVTKEVTKYLDCNTLINFYDSSKELRKEIPINIIGVRLALETIREGIRRISIALVYNEELTLDQIKVELKKLIPLYPLRYKKFKDSKYDLVKNQVLNNFESRAWISSLTKNQAREYYLVTGTFNIRHCLEFFMNECCRNLELNLFKCESYPSVEDLNMVTFSKRIINDYNKVFKNQDKHKKRWLYEYDDQVSSDISLLSFNTDTDITSDSSNTSFTFNTIYTDTDYYRNYKNLHSDYERYYYEKLEQIKHDYIRELSTETVRNLLSNAVKKYSISEGDVSDYSY